MKSSTPNILVVGNGIAGRCVAYRLLQKGCQVSLSFDENSKPDASYAAQGLSSVKGLLFPRSNLFGMKIKGHFALRRLLRDLNLFDDEKIRDRVFEPFHNELEKKSIFSRIYKHQFHGAYKKRLIESETLLPSPLLGQGYRGAWCYPQDFFGLFRHEPKYIRTNV